MTYMASKMLINRTLYCTDGHWFIQGLTQNVDTSQHESNTNIWLGTAAVFLCLQDLAAGCSVWTLHVRVRTLDGSATYWRLWCTPGMQRHGNGDALTHTLLSLALEAGRTAVQLVSTTCCLEHRGHRGRGGLGVKVRVERVEQCLG